MFDAPLARVAATFFWIGIVSFGGGLAVMPEIHHQLVDRHAWITAQELTDGYAIGQLAPGPNMLAIVFYGFRMAGVAGGLIAVLMAFLPGALLSAVVARAWLGLRASSAVRALRRGIIPVGVGLMVGGVFVVGRGSVRSLAPAGVAAAVALVVERKWVHPALAVLAAGAVGLAFGF